MKSSILKISSLEGLVDEEFCISVSSLPPSQKITISAKTYSAEGGLWISSADFKADCQGNVNLQTDAPIAGSYDQMDQMGLIWSMKPEDGKPSTFQLPPDGMRISISLEIEEELVDQIEVYRSLRKKTVSRHYIADQGFVGTLFLPASDHPLPAIITLTGSNGGLKESRAELLASHGYVTLALAYFGTEGLPAKLENIPLEYFVQTIEWLKKRPEVDPSRIGLWGVSRGGELSLLLGAMFPDRIAAIAAYVPSSAVYGSQENPEASVWTYQGSPIVPPAPLVNSYTMDPQLGLTADRPIPLASFCMQAITQRPDAYAASIIPVEKIKASLLVVAGEDDQMWPSAFFAKEIAKRLDLFHSPIERKILIYPDAGHQMIPPYLPVPSSLNLHPVVHKWFNLGGNPICNAFAGRDAWKETLSFFSRTLFSK